MSIAAFLVAMVGPLAARLLAAFGVSLVTLGGLVAATTTLRGIITTNLGNLPIDGLELCGLFGVWTCMGLALGAVTFVITWKSTTGFMALAKA